MFYSGINTDFAAYKTKVALGLTKRQIICFLLAAILGFPTYFFTRGYIGNDIAGIVMVLIMIPFFLLGMYEKNGKNLETLIREYIKEQRREKVRKVIYTPILSQVNQCATYARSIKKDKGHTRPQKGRMGHKKDKRGDKGQKDKNAPKEPVNVLNDKITRPEDKESTEMLRDYAKMMHTAGKSHKRGPISAAESLPFKRMNESGLCYLGDNKYSIMLKFNDINYIQLDEEEQKDFWSSYCMFLNTLDPDATYQFSFFNSEADVESLAKELEIYSSDEGEKGQVVKELNDHIESIVRSGNKGLSKDMYFLVTFKSVRKKANAKASEYAERIKRDLYDKLGVKARVLSGYERLAVLSKMINLNKDEQMILSFDLNKSGGLNEKEQIINHPFIFGKKADRFETGGKVACASFLKINASRLSDGFLNKFLDLDCGLIISIHIEPVDREKASKDVRRLVSDVQKNIIDEQKTASNNGYSMANVSAPLKTNLEAAERILDGITQNDEKMFMAVVSFVFFADSVSRLDRNYGLAKSIASEENCDLIRLDHTQEDGYFSSLPIGVNTINIKRQLTTTSLGMFLPFKIKELFMKGKDSLCFGKNKITGNIIMADIKKLPNPNTIILGTPGRGKSFKIKLLIIQIMAKLRDVLFINDPEGEYRRPVEFLGGVVIKLSQAGKNFINLFDIDPDVDLSTKPTSDKSQLMMSVFELIMGPGKSEPNDKSIIDRCINKIYEKFLITKDTKDIPILEDFYNELAKQEGQRAKYLREVLEVYVHGGLNFFNHRTNIDLNNRLVCFDTKELGDHLKPLAMLIIQETVWGKVAANRNIKKHTWYICDEFHLLLKDPQTAMYSKEIYKRFRKWGGIPVAITQNVTDLLDSSEAQSIFYNSDCFILLGQDTGDADKLSEALKLSKEQYKCILTRNKGEGLFIYGDTVIPFSDHINEDTLLYKLLTTKVTEAEGV